MVTLTFTSQHLQPPSLHNEESWRQKKPTVHQKLNLLFRNQNDSTVTDVSSEETNELRLFHQPSSHVWKCGPEVLSTINVSDSKFKGIQLHEEKQPSEMLEPNFLGNIQVNIRPEKLLLQSLTQNGHFLYDSVREPINNPLSLWQHSTQLSIGGPRLINEVLLPDIFLQTDVYSIHNSHIWLADLFVLVVRLFCISEEKSNHQTFHLGGTDREDQTPSVSHSGDTITVKEEETVSWR